jgi:hypothetical protein
MGLIVDDSFIQPIGLKVTECLVVPFFRVLFDVGGGGGGVDNTFLPVVLLCLELV